jgi:hypothetical protein
MVREGRSLFDDEGIGDRSLTSDIMTTKQHKQKTMIQTLDALFDGEILVPEVPLNIKSGMRVRIIVESLLPENKPTQKSFLQTAKSLNLQGHPDWSENIDQYLYGENLK